MRWTLVIKEVSAGCYECEAIRQDHQSISKRGFESVISELLQETYDSEVALGTPHHEAAFYVTEALKPQWHTAFDPGGAGSWSVFSQREPRSIDYEGQEKVLRIQRDGEISWRGSIDSLGADGEFFRQLVLT